MKKINTIVVAPHFYTMEGEGVGYRSAAAMAVDGGKILEVGDQAKILAEYGVYRGGNHYSGSPHGSARLY